MNYKEVEGNLITMAKNEEFDVITHGCNCFCTMGAGIAPQMAEAFSCDRFFLERPEFAGDIEKLGRIEVASSYVKKDKGVIAYVTDTTRRNLEEKGFKRLRVINSYTQFGFGFNHINGELKPLDYEALSLCLKKINHKFPGMHIGIPQIGCGLAGGDWNIVQKMIKELLLDMKVTTVIYKPELAKV